MKILCLHGHGTNSSILEYQMSGLRQKADPSWEFYYLEGEVECPPAAGIENTFSGPYLCYTRTFNWKSEATAHALIDEFIEEEGPFDGVFCFSQGTAILVSYLLERVAEDCNKPLPFQFAILCSSTLPLAANSTYFHSLVESLDHEDEARIRSAEDDQIAQLTGPVQIVIGSLVKILDFTETITRQPRSFFLDRELSEIPWALHPDICSTRIPIPSLHVIGKEESGLRESSSIAQSFFQSKKKRVFEHSGGHDIPRSGLEVHQMLSAMEWVVSQSQLPTE